MLITNVKNWNQLKVLTSKEVTGIMDYQLAASEVGLTKHMSVDT